MPEIQGTVVHRQADIFSVCQETISENVLESDRSQPFYAPLGRFPYFYLVSRRNTAPPPMTSQPPSIVVLCTGQMISASTWIEPLKKSFVYTPNLPAPDLEVLLFPPCMILGPYSYLGTWMSNMNTSCW